MRRLSLAYKGKRFTLKVHEVGFFRRGIGLMFRSSRTKILLFSFRHPSRVAITSYFVFFPFVAVWLNKRGTVLEARIIKPFVVAVRPRFPSSYLVEIPFSPGTSRITRFLVGK